MIKPQNNIGALDGDVVSTLVPESQEQTLLLPANLLFIVYAYLLAVASATTEAG